MKLEVLEKDKIYHIYNRGINGETIFNSNENKRYFLKLYSKYLENKADTFAYCLMDNHFHFIIRIVNEKETTIYNTGECAFIEGTIWTTWDKMNLYF